MAVIDAVDRGREAFRRRAWGARSPMLSAADAGFAARSGDVERLAAAAHLVGRVDDASTTWDGPHGYAAAGECERCAARCAFWAAFVLLNRGELARGSGWVHRGAAAAGRRQLTAWNWAISATAPRSAGVRR